MIRNAGFLSAMLLAGLLFGLPARAQDQPLRAVSFSKEVLPILKTSCGKCHTGGGAKGKLDLSTYAGLKKGGSDGPAVVEGDPGKSPLVTSISGDKPEMPKKAAPLTKAQISTISTWVKEGAKNN
ncbi:MAG TPA: c-type cytochrome domain-containing protein [Planctomycetota bacterium]|nr:c-type cytochrome domain-containing protein [Planctomycetota bacterium]